MYVIKISLKLVYGAVTLGEEDREERVGTEVKQRVQKGSVWPLYVLDWLSLIR